MKGNLRAKAGFTAFLMLALAAVLLIAPGQASANHLNEGLAVSLGSPIRLVNGVYLQVPVQVTCPATFEAPFTAIGTEEIGVSVTQKVGRDFAQGYGGLFYQSPIFNGLEFGTPLTCDGSAHSYTVEVYPDSYAGSAPFHGGRAVANARLGIYLVDPANPWWLQDSNSASTGSTSISIRGG
jgi:hypothetical protein